MFEHITQSVKKNLCFLGILFQAIVGVGAGLAAVSLYEGENLPPGTRLGDLAVGTKTLKEIESLAKPYFHDGIESAKFTLAVGDEVYAIAYRDVGAFLDVEKTLDALAAQQPENIFKRLFTFLERPMAVSPSIALNSDLLRTELIKHIGKYEAETLREKYEVRDGQLFYTPEIPGVQPDYEQFALELEQRMGSFSKDSLSIKLEEGPYFSFVKTQKTTGGSFQYLVSQAQMPCPSNMGAQLMALASKLDGVVIEPGQSFNLKEQLKGADLAGELGQDGLNRTATSLYQSVLSVPEIKVTKRTGAKKPVVYAQPGLEAVMEASGDNLVWENATGKPLMVIMSLNEGTLSLSLLSTGEVKSGVVYARVKDVKEPPAAYTINEDLAPGESRIITPGIPGATVEVERLVNDERTWLYEASYEPVTAIVEKAEEPIRTGSK